LNREKKRIFEYVKKFQKTEKFYSGTAAPPADHRAGVVNFILLTVFFFPENEERDESCLVRERVYIEGSWENGLLVWYRDIYISIITCKPTHPFTIRSLSLNHQISLSFLI